MTALGRQEEWEDSPEGYPQTPPYKWWNWHDEYAAASADPRWVKVVENAKETLNLWRQCGHATWPLTSEACR